MAGSAYYSNFLTKTGPEPNPVKNLVRVSNFPCSQAGSVDATRKEYIIIVKKSFLNIFHGVIVNEVWNFVPNETVLTIGANKQKFRKGGLLKKNT